MLITPEQIRAARAWIGWTRDALAEESGVSSATIRNLENGKISFRSIEGVRAALENKGFKFYGKNGISRQTGESRTYEGAGSCDAFYEELISAAKANKNAEIAAIFRTKELLARALGVTDYARLERLEELARLAAVKCLLSNANQTPLAIPHIQFRATTYNPLGPMGSFIYGDKTVIVVTNGMDSTYHVMKSVEIAQDSRKDFVLRWDTAAPLDMQPAPLKRQA